MVPSKPEDFTAAHPGFEGQEEGGGYLPADPTAPKGCHYGINLALGNTSVAWWRGRRLSDILERVGPDQPPSDGL